YAVDDAQAAMPERGLRPHGETLGVGTPMSHDVGHPADDLRVPRSESFPASQSGNPAHRALPFPPHRSSHRRAHSSKATSVQSWLDRSRPARWGSSGSPATTRG